MSSIDLPDLVRSMAKRDSVRSEADLQAEVRSFLLYGGLDLDDASIEVLLETPAGGGKRIDIEAGFAVIEVKKDLRVGNTQAKAIPQLADYLIRRTEQMDNRYVGVLTDGADWFLYTLDVNEQAKEVSHLSISTADPNVEGLQLWLEGVLATRQGIAPTPPEIRRRLGAGTSSFSLDRATLESLYSACRDDEEVKTKRMLWARLLTTAFGSQFKDEDALFIEHTYLVMVAELIAHVTVGLDIRDPTLSPADLLSGKYFSQTNIAGVVEADFFDWVVSRPAGGKMVRDLARRIARFNWAFVDHDVLKVLYESVVDAEQRHSLGEYYTPDWLAERMVDEVYTDPLQQRVLDPACGSGTFLLYLVRRNLAAADAAGVSNSEAIDRLVTQVHGVDVHPVAVTLARVTYLLAIGLSRLQDRGPISIPVHIGDSLQWGKEETLYTQDSLVVPIGDRAELITNNLRFPLAVTEDADRFDRLVAELAERATSREHGARPFPAINALMKRYSVADEDREAVETAFMTLCRLHDDRRDHIWGYYVRNLVRPYWLSQPSHRPDLIIGNPPWLSYRFMTKDMKDRFKADSQERGIWAGAELATSQDLSGYFLVRCTQLYLRTGGKFAFVMPNAVLSRPHFEGFRSGKWSSSREETSAHLETPWDIQAVRPHVFPMPASVVFGARSDRSKQMSKEALVWTGTLSSENAKWDAAERELISERQPIARPTGAKSPYASDFRQGATIVPRGLMTVEALPAGPLGLPRGMVRIRTIKSSQEKKPWKDLPRIEGTIEGQFVLSLYLGVTLGPFRCFEPVAAVIPWDGQALLDENDPALDEYPGLANWWRDVNDLWTKHRKSEQMSLAERIDFHGLLRTQFPIKKHRVIYNRSGSRLMAAYVTDADAVIDTKLYWGEVDSVDEADYLCAVLNSPKMTELINPIQSRGHYGPRDFYSLPFEFGISRFDPAKRLHEEVAKLGRAARQFAGKIELVAPIKVQPARRTISAALADSGLLKQLDGLVERLLE